MNLLKNELDIYSSLFTKGYEMINKAEKENPNKLYSQNDSKIGARQRLFLQKQWKGKIDFYKHLYESQNNKYFQFSVHQQNIKRHQSIKQVLKNWLSRLNAPTILMN